MAEGIGEEMLENVVQGLEFGNDCWQCNFNKQKVKQENECGDEDDGVPCAEPESIDGEYGNDCWQCNFNKQKVKQENECGDEDDGALDSNS